MGVGRVQRQEEEEQEEKEGHGQREKRQEEQLSLPHRGFGGAGARRPLALQPENAEAAVAEPKHDEHATGVWTQEAGSERRCTATTRRGEIWTLKISLHIFLFVPQVV